MTHHDWFKSRRPVRKLRDELEACRIADRERTKKGEQDRFLDQMAHGINLDPRAWQLQYFGKRKGR